jgi:hypothetical protein
MMCDRGIILRSISSGGLLPLPDVFSIKIGGKSYGSFRSNGATEVSFPIPVFVPAGIEVVVEPVSEGVWFFVSATIAI